MKKANKNIELESVTVQVPKEVMNLIRAFAAHGLGMTVKEYLEHSIVQVVSADLDAGDVFTVEPEELIAQYNLNLALSTVA